MTGTRSVAAILLLLSISLAPSTAPAAGEPGALSGVEGGVVVHLGCGDGAGTVKLARSDAFLVHGLDVASPAIQRARARLDAAGVYGQASAEVYDGRGLPYGDNIVNLIVIENAADVPVEEIERVLAPGGVAMIATDGDRLENSALEAAGTVDGWAKYVKSWPDEIDQWTHYLYDASGNAVTSDQRVHRPRHAQWRAGPKRTRHHDGLASLSAMTTSNGRVFYIVDEGPISLVHRPPQWKLIARDAFNGKLLWKRDIAEWMPHLYNFRAGPKQLPRRLVSVGDDVFVTLGLSAPVVRLDAATGETALTFGDSAKTEEIICHDGMLIGLVGDPDILIEKADGAVGYWEMAEYEEPTVEKSIVAWDAATGRRLWTIEGENLERAVPLSLCAQGDRVFYLDDRNLHCVSARTGDSIWQSPFETEGLFIRAYAPTVVVKDDVILCLKWDRLEAWSVEDGRPLWNNKGAMGFGSPADLFVIDGKAWTVPMMKAIWRDKTTDEDGIARSGVIIPKDKFLNDAKTAVAVDTHTGEIVDLAPFAHTQHHHRCYRNKATRDYLLIGHSGIQVLDLDTKSTETHRWVRGLCQYGIMPANGCIYVPPDPCQCYGSGKINGLFALAETNSWADVEVEPALEKGAAWSRISKNARTEPRDIEREWPTYRGGPARTAAARCVLPAEPEVRWGAEIGETITAPVIADGRVFVADRDAYAVYCLSAADGAPVWKYLANGPVDSPPTIAGDLCLFGCGDGSVYCLDAKTGDLAWRFKTSRTERRIGHDDRLESPLRIHGSPLVIDDTVYFAAGYSSNLDGGIRLYGLDARTGEQRCANRIGTGCWGDTPGWGYLADILVFDGETISMRNLSLDRDLKVVKRRGLIVASTGFLEDAWFNRMGWRTRDGGAGQLIAFDENRSVGVANPYSGLKRRRAKFYKEFDQVGHFHQKFTRYRPEHFPIGASLKAVETGRADPAWSQDTPIQPRAMVLGERRLCLAGWKDSLAIEMKTGRARDPQNPDPRESVLRYRIAATGDLVLEQPLEAEPVFDGMAAADGRLFVSLKNGRLLCLAD